jgi:hypothetical protein
VLKGFSGSNRRGRAFVTIPTTAGTKLGVYPAARLGGILRIRAAIISVGEITKGGMHAS